MKTPAPLTPELSRLLRVDRVPLGGIEEHIVAAPLERAGLKQRFSLLDLPRLEAHLNVDREQGHMLAVTGHFLADVVQECVITLEPVSSRIEAEINVLFAPPHLIKEDREGALGDLGDAEPPEPIENGTIDLGELVAQHLAMALDPYPRKDGVSLGRVEVGAKIEEKAVTNPFVRLVQEAGKEEK